jgi:hypothetical protein
MLQEVGGTCGLTSIFGGRQHRYLFVIPVRVHGKTSAANSATAWRRHLREKFRTPSPPSSQRPAQPAAQAPLLARPEFGAQPRRRLPRDPLRVDRIIGSSALLAGLGRRVFHQLDRLALSGPRLVRTLSHIADFLFCPCDEQQPFLAFLVGAIRDGELLAQRLVRLFVACVTHYAGESDAR